MSRQSAENKKLKNKYLWIAISFVVAVGLWFFVEATTDPTASRTFVDVPVETINENALADNGLTLPFDIPDTVNVRVSGDWRSVIRMKMSNLSVTVDLSKCTEGENVLKVNAEVKRGSTEVVSVSPAEITVQADPIEKKEKPVEVTFSRGVPDKREAVCLSQELEYVVVTGAKTRVDMVDHIRAEVSSSALTDDPEEYTVELRAVSKDGTDVDNVRLSADSMTLSAQTFAVKSVSLELDTYGSVPDGLELTGLKCAQVIMIAAPKDEIEKIESIRAESIDLSQISESQTVKLRLILPGNAKLASAETSPEAEVTIGKIQ